MFSAFLLVFFSLFLAQIGDKTQLLTLLIATRTKKHFILFWAIMAGFTIGVTLAVIFGSGLTLFVPHKILKMISSLIFIILGILIFLDGRKSVKKTKKLHFRHMFLSVAGLIFLTDFGDKTQIAIALFASTYHPLLVFLAGIVSLGLNTLIVIFFSKAIMHKVNEKIIEKIAGTAFVAIGIFLLIF